MYLQARRASARNAFGAAATIMSLLIAGPAQAANACEAMLQIAAGLSDPTKLKGEKITETEWSASQTMPGFDSCLVELNRDGSHDFRCKKDTGSSRSSVEFLKSVVETDLRPCGSHDSIRLSQDLTPILEPGDLPEGMIYMISVFHLNLGPEAGSSSLYLGMNGFPRLGDNFQSVTRHDVTLRISN